MKILVADDEFYARKAIVKMLRELNLDLTVAADLETGRDAAGYLRDHPDIRLVITDIRMPEMDGLELARHISERYPGIAVIIVTGYADFDYARQAILYRVQDYITKPVSRDELRGAVERFISGERDQRREIEDEIEDRLFTMSKEQLSMKELMRSEDLQQRFMGACRVYAAQLPCRILLFQLDAAQAGAHKEWVLGEIERRMSAQVHDLYYFRTNDEFVLLYFSEHAREETEKLVITARRVLGAVRAHTGLAAVASVSKCHEGMNHLYDAYKESVYAINQRLLEGWDGVYVYEAQKTGSGVPALDRAAEIELRGALDASDFARAKKVIVEVFEDPVLLSNGDIYALYNRIISVLEILNQHYHSSASDEISREKMLLMFSRRYDLYNFKHMSELENYLFGIAQELCSAGAPERANHAIIDEILEYISRSYQYDISLRKLAEQKYFMNPSYLSRLFKAAVGKTFSRYIIEYRLERSRDLLENSILKISDIAAHVGYNDASHYIQSFRRLYGVTPEEYRVRASRGESMEPAADNSEGR